MNPTPQPFTGPVLWHDEASPMVTPPPGPTAASGPSTTTTTPEGKAVSSQLGAALSRSPALAEAVARGDVGRVLEIVKEEANPIVSSALQHAAASAHASPVPQASHQHNSHQQVVPLPLHNFPDLPVDNFPDLPGFHMDPFGVDLTLSNNAPPPPMYQNEHEHNPPPPSPSPSPSPPPQASVGGSIQQQVQSEVSRLRLLLLALEQRASCASCVQRSWSQQRMPWRIKVKKATNFADLLVKLKELRKAMTPFATKNADLDHFLARLSPTNITANKLSRCLEDFRACVERNYPAGGSGPPLRLELAKIARAVDDSSKSGVEVFTRLPLSEIFAKQPDVAQSLRQLLQRQKLEIVAKLAELNTGAQGGGLSAGGGAAVHVQSFPSREDDEFATDMSDSD